MADITLTAAARTEFGKGAARRLRRANQVPAVLYGHGTDPVHVSLPGHDTMMALKHTNALVQIDLDGTTTLTIVKDVQVEPVRQIIEHVDLLIVRRGEKVTVDVPVHLVGTSAPGTIHVLESQTLSVEAEATHLPSAIEVDLTGMGDGTVLHAGQVALPRGTSLLTDADHIVLTVSLPAAGEPAEVEAVEA
jgi:large subunit ribosomal protein L25